MSTLAMQRSLTTLAETYRPNHLKVRSGSIMNALPCHQNGAALMVSLMILLVLTLIGVTSMQSTILEEKMAGNMRDKNLAFNAAESALREGENWVAPMTSIPEPVDSCSPAPCTLWNPGILPDLSDQNHSWWTGNAVAVGTSIPEVNSNPHYLMEYLAFIPDDLDPETRAQGIGNHFYRTTARGTGGSDVAEAVLQTTYIKRFR